MTRWRKEIIDKFKHNINNIVLVHDSDYLLNDDLILHGLKQLGFDVIRFENSISFRFIYEKEYRSKAADSKIIIYTNDHIVFPYEYIEKAIEITLAVNYLFPNMPSKIIQSLNHEQLDLLYTIYPRYQGSSDEDAMTFVVKHLFKIPYEIIDTEAELYKLLLSLHYSNTEIPQPIQFFLIEKLQNVVSFQSLPVEELIKSKAFFYHYLEKIWKEYVDQVASIKEDHAHENSSEYVQHPLANDDVRRLMSDLFIEGRLTKAGHVNNIGTLPKWMYVGIEEGLNQNDIAAKRKTYIETITTKLTSVKQYGDWIEIVQLLSDLEFTKLNQQQDNEIKRLFKEINQHFYQWMSDRYHMLMSLPPYPRPKLVHHIPHVISRERVNDEKVALLVLDGMSYMQWRIVQKHLKIKGFFTDETGVFAWVPTLTSVSRQAIFSGNMPFSFYSSIHRTSAEERLWKSFWENQGVLKQYVAYQKGLGSNYDKDQIPALNRKSVKVFGAVIDIIDQMTHSAVQGEQSIKSELDIWLKSNFLVDFLNDLIDANYTVYITSDHGNTTSTGIGRYSEGVLVEQRGERVRIYKDQTFLNDAASKLQSIIWSNAGLPENYYALLANYGEAFVPKDQAVVTHGGISIEEVIVPFARIQRKGSVLSD